MNPNHADKPPCTATASHARRLPVALILLICLSLPAGSSANQPAEQPDQVVNRLHQALIDTMRQGAELGYRGRWQRLAPIITGCFDLTFIARIILGRHWNTLTEAQQTRFIDTFTQLTIAHYAFHFDSYQDQTFQATANTPLKKARFLIKTRLTSTRNKPVSLDYIVHNSGDNWRIIGVIADGVNDLSLKRTEYGGIIKDRGINGLLEELSDKIKAMAGNG